MAAGNQHSDKVLNVLGEISEQRDKLRQAGHECLTAGEGALYQIDLVVIGAVKRAVSMSAAFDQLVRAWNMVVARALLRMQIDTAIRFGALRIVEDPEQFAGAVLGGERIDKLKDRDGHRMTDRHLVKALSPVAPWLENVYQRASGYVHMSESFIFAPIRRLDDETRTAQFVINEEDHNFPEWSWLEVTDCFRDTTSLVLAELNAWAELKRGLSSAPERGGRD